MPADNIKIAGLKDFRKELKKLDDDGLLGELKDVNVDVAESVVRAARANAAGQGRMQSKAADSLKASRSGTKAAVTGGGGNAPFFGGAEFGAAQNQPRNTVRGIVAGWNQFEPWRGSSAAAGYFLYPAIRERTDEIIEMYGDAIMKIARRAFPD